MSAEEKSIEVEGRISLKVVEVDLIKHRFRNAEERAFEVKVTGVRNDGNGGIEKAEAYLPITNDYLPAAMQADGIEKECQRTFDTLAKLGVPGDGMELAKAEDTLVGQVLEFFGKKNTKGHLNWYINTKKPEEKVDPKKAQKQIAELYGSGSTSAPAPANKKPVGKAVEVDEGDQLPMGDDNEASPF